MLKTVYMKEKMLYNCVVFFDIGFYKKCARKMPRLQRGIEFTSPLSESEIQYA